MSYEITQEDIEDYLDSKADDEVVGITCDGGRCLVAEAFRMKYPDTNVIVTSVEISIWPPDAVEWDTIGTDRAIRETVQRFDYIAFDDDSEDEVEIGVTKREWLEVRP